MAYKLDSHTCLGTKTRWCWRLFFKRPRFYFLKMISVWYFCAQMAVYHEHQVESSPKFTDSWRICAKWNSVRVNCWDALAHTAVPSLMSCKSITCMMLGLKNNDVTVELRDVLADAASCNKMCFVCEQTCMLERLYWNLVPLTNTWHAVLLMSLVFKDHQDDKATKWQCDGHEIVARNSISC